jgi:hypothetical protein
MSAFTPERLAYLEAHKDESRVTEIYWVYSVPIAAATISTALRLWAKRVGRNGITLDDYLIVFATVRFAATPPFTTVAHHPQQICLIGECASGLGFGTEHPEWNP